MGNMSVVERLARAMYASYKFKRPWTKANPTWHIACRRNAKILLRISKTYGLSIGFNRASPADPSQSETPTVNRG